jgi:uncharacterized protein (DUF1684 family)
LTVRTTLAVISFVCLLTAADRLPRDYARSIEQFRAHRQEEIAGKNGWITLAGLFWLKHGDNRVGTDEAFEVALPASAPKRAGTVVVKSGSARFVPGRGISAKETAFKLDDESSAVVFGSVHFWIIKREGKLAARVKDSESPARKAFTGLVWYPVDPSWRIAAKFTPWPDRRTIVFGTAAGTKEEMESPGSVTFSRNGAEFHLDPVLEDGRLFFVMRDSTSGKSTYGAARFVYADPPPGGFKKSGTVWLDFNQAINPPCMFTPYATCPLPPPQNRLPLDVTAGEKLYGPGH